MAYYLLTVLEQDGGVEVQRLVKNLVRSRVSVACFKVKTSCMSIVTKCLFKKVVLS